MKVVYKYVLNLIPGMQRLRIPVHFKVLHCGMDLNVNSGATSVVGLWLELDSESTEVTEYQFEIFATGQRINDDTYEHFGTFIKEHLDFNGRPYMQEVWHIYGEAAK